jgi:hypothetical protein
MPKKNRREVQPPPVLRVVRRPLLISLGLGCWLWPGLTAHAQQALLSALSLDSIVQAQQTNNAPVPRQPDLPHLGPVQLSLGAYSSLALDDNINLSQNSPQSDAIVGTGANIGFSWLATGLTQLNFSSQVGYDFYLRHPEDDYVQIAPGSALTWNFVIDDWVLTFFDQFNYTRNVISVAAVSNVSGIPIIDNTIGLRAQWQPGHWQIQTGYSYNNYFSTATAFDYLNNASDYFFARGAWLFSGDAALGLEASASITDYSHQTGSDNTSYSVGPYLEWQVDRFLHVSLHGGPTFYMFAANSEGQSANNLGSYYVNFDLTHQLTAFLSQELSVQRSVSLGYTLGTTYTEQLSASYLVRWQAKPWLNFWLGLNYQDGEQPYYYFVNYGVFSAEAGTTENFDRYGISSGVSYQITQKINANLSYAHWNRGSNISGNSYADDNISLQFQYSF